MCCIHFSDTNSLSCVDNTTVWLLLQSPAVLSFSHYGVSSNVTHLTCAWQIYPYMMFALYAGMLKKGVCGHERLGFQVMLRMSNSSELILGCNSCGW